MNFSLSVNYGIVLKNMFELNPGDKKIKKTLPEYFADNIWITPAATSPPH
jgi:hypothetical protein